MSNDIGMGVRSGTSGLRRGRSSMRVPGPRATAVIKASVIATSLIALLLLPACSREHASQGRPSAPAVPVMVADAVRQDVPVTLRVIGAVDAYNIVRVRARVGGQLVGVGFKEGQNVRAGDVLFQIDPRPFETALQSALANSARDSAQALSADAQEQRYAGLVQKDYVTKQQYDEVKANAAALHATLQADAAACSNARLNLGFCTIRAPISGRTGSLLVQQGNLIGANDANPLVVIQQLVPIYVSFSIPEQRLAEVRKYSAAGALRAEAVVNGDTTAVHTGELTFIDNAVDETTGTILLKATFANADESLWPGQFVNVSLILTHRPDAIVVPSPAIQTGQQGNFVYIVKPDLTVALQPVTIGTTTDGDTVVETGVQAGDRVVTDGQLRLTPGAKVDIKPGLNSAASTTDRPAANSTAGADDKSGTRPGATATR
jgi:membrane fusion protein, multidrug efflux system